MDADVDERARRETEALAPVPHGGQQVGVALAQDPGAMVEWEG
ncbi:hypothetical protein [Streptomyces flaveolus]